MEPGATQRILFPADLRANSNVATDAQSHRKVSVVATTDNENRPAMPDPSRPPAVFVARTVTKTYRLGEIEVQALRGIDLDLYQGEFVVLLGPSNLIFAAIIACGVVYNSARIAVAERSRDLASLRVLGYTRGEISRILLPGRLSRVQLQPGDQVQAGKTQLTTVDPTAPALLDARARAESEARLKMAEATRKRCEPVLERARITVKFADEEFERAKKLGRDNIISHEDMDRLELRAQSAHEDLKAAQFALQIADHELELARAAMIHANRENHSSHDSADDWRIEILSPIDGQVLRVFHESSAVVAAGTPLMELGDARDLEVVVDVLSSDAVKIKAGDDVLLEDWGGATLRGRVRLIEPSGFTKVSALGVEEQRVNVIIDFSDPLDLRAGLGDDFRVEARIVVDQANDVLKIPNGTLFRDQDHYAVFVVEDGRAQLRHVTVGRRGRLESEITDGLEEPEEVIIYPSDKVHDGAAVVPH